MSLFNILLQIATIRKEAREELYTFGQYFLVIMDGAFNFIHGLNPIKKGGGTVLSLIGNQIYTFTGFYIPVPFPVSFFVFDRS